MTRLAARTDRNQAEIVAALRQAGATVQHLHTLGRGCPDILVGYRGANYLMEIKAPGGRVTPDEAAWLQAWRGRAAIVASAQQALEEIGAAACLPTA